MPNTEKLKNIVLRILSSLDWKLCPDKHNLFQGKPFLEAHHTNEEIQLFVDMQGQYEKLQLESGVTALVGKLDISLMFDRQNMIAPFIDENFLQLNSKGLAIEEVPVEEELSLEDLFHQLIDSDGGREALMGLCSKHLDLHIRFDEDAKTYLTLPVTRLKR